MAARKARKSTLKEPSSRARSGSRPAASAGRSSKAAASKRDASKRKAEKTVSKKSLRRKSAEELAERDALKKGTKKLSAKAGKTSGRSSVEGRDKKSSLKRSSKTEAASTKRSKRPEQGAERPLKKKKKLKGLKAEEGVKLKKKKLRPADEAPLKKAAEKRPEEPLKSKKLKLKKRRLEAEGAGPKEEVPTERKLKKGLKKKKLLRLGQEATGKVKKLRKPDEEPAKAIEKKIAKDEREGVKAKAIKSLDPNAPGLEALRKALRVPELSALAAKKPAKPSEPPAPAPSKKMVVPARGAKLKSVEVPAAPTKANPPAAARARSAPAAAPRPPVPGPVAVELPRPSLEERAASVAERLAKQPAEIQKEYEDRLYMSWIHHDSALEGVVYSFQELQLAIDPAITVVPDSSIQPICDEIRRHKAAIDFVREGAIKKRVPITADMIKRIYLYLHPEEGDLKTVKYRKDIPQHRLYFHEYAPPDKIAYAVRQVVEWVNDPETRRTRTIVRMAARAHYDLLRAFPFPNDSGKVARLLMNFILLRAGYPPAIIHSTERQRYYEALKGSPLAIVHMVQEALENSIASIEKYLDERTTRVRSFIS